MSRTEVLARVARWMVPAVALLFLPFVVDVLDPSSEPWIDLTGAVALVAWLFAESGQTFGIVAIAGALLAVLVTRPGPTVRERAVEGAVVIVVSIVALYGGKLLNDHVVKPAVGVARPDVVLLADAGELGMEVDEFYAMPEDDRSAYLDAIKGEDGFGTIELRPEVRDHWVKETAFARPSGHALASMTFATYYVAIAIAWLSGWRRRTFLLLVPWAVLVSLSRPVLRVHWPADIVLGGLAGLAIGAGAFLLTSVLVERRWAGPDVPDVATGPRDGRPADPGSPC